MNKQDEIDIRVIYSSYLDQALLNQFVKDLDDFLMRHPNEVDISLRDEKGKRRRHFTIFHIFFNKSGLPGVVAGHGAVKNEADGNYYSIIRLDERNEEVRRLAPQFKFPYVKEKSGQKTNNVNVILAEATVACLPTLLEAQLRWFRQFMMIPENEVNNIITTVPASVKSANDNAKGVDSNDTDRVIEPPKIADFIASAEPSERQKITSYRIIRDWPLATEIKKLYKYHCQLCGTLLKSESNVPYAEAHHIKPLGEPHNGSDTPDNILCVCPNCHAMLDKGYIKIDEKILNHDLSHRIAPGFINYHNTAIYHK